MDLKAMSFNRVLLAAAALAASGGGLAGCTDARKDLSPDFGVALRSNLAAQIADPEARYEGVLQPGGDGARAALAATRYGKNQVIQPAQASTSSIDNKGAAKSPAN
jgi:type IV pilus biogenesis protein CpaD/CtpE